MLSGKRFRLNRKTLAVGASEGTKTATYLPEHAIITVKSGPTKTDSRMVEVLWDGRPLIMFVEDIQERGEEVSEQSA
jgi:hypothetical protein